ncbi:MAG: septum formation initiator family protein [Patescibacteria group bacterium]|nr:septum formation initiator family protein [Patescibacteria group bacterium]
MAEFKKKENSFWYSPLMLVIFFLITVFLGYNIIDLIKKEKETNQKKNVILDESNALKEREEKLINDIAELQTEQGAEKAIREKYQVVKEGEGLIMIIDTEEEDEESTKKEHGFLNWLKRN